jgi:hypothetical protein
MTREEIAFVRKANSRLQEGTRFFRTLLRFLVSDSIPKDSSQNYVITDFPSYEAN